MLLCDRLASYDPVPTNVQNGAVSIGRAPQSSGLAAVMRDCQARYVVNEQLVRQCVFAITDQMDCLRAALHRDLRLSNALTWVEWCEPGSGLWAEDAGSARAKRRAGVLIHANDDTFRSGALKSFWIGDNDHPQQSIATFHFDFDTPISDGPAPFRFDRSAPHADDFEAFLRHTAFRVDRDVAAELQKRAPDQATYLQRVKDLYAASLTDLLIFCAFQLMLNMPKALDLAPSNRAALNKVRARRSLGPLLEYYEATLNLTPATTRTGHGEQTDDRRAPRMHWVRGHFVRRDDRVFWRRCHLRGDGDESAIAPRTTFVNAGRRLSDLLAVS